jgi:hypothetical protein
MIDHSTEGYVTLDVSQIEGESLEHYLLKRQLLWVNQDITFERQQLAYWQTQILGTNDDCGNEIITEIYHRMDNLDKKRQRILRGIV